MAARHGSPKTLQISCTYCIIKLCPIDPNWGCGSSPLAIPSVEAVASTEGEEWPPPAPGPRRPPTRASRSSPSGTCGCTSRATAPTTDGEVPIIVRGEGPYVWDEHGNRYLDGLSALFCVNAGHGRTELGDAAARQVAELDFFTIWSYAHPRAIELATRIASLAPGDLNRVFFTSGGSEAVESAIKLARAYHQRTGNPRKTKFISREIAYHGTTLGALAATGISALRYEFEPLVPGGYQVPNTDSYRWPPDRDPLWAADQIEEKIIYEHPDTVAAVILEPLQNAGGCIPPPGGVLPARARDLRPPQRPADLRRGDLRLGAARPLVRLRALRLPARHRDDRQGADLGIRADGRPDRIGPRRRAVHARQRVVRPRPHLRRPPRRGRGSDGEPRRLRARGHLRPRAAQGGRAPRRCSTRCATSRSSATCAATASSTRSSWSRTRRPRRGSPTRSRSGSCAATCRASCSAAV